MLLSDKTQTHACTHTHTHTHTQVNAKLLRSISDDNMTLLLRRRRDALESDIGDLLAEKEQAKGKGLKPMPPADLAPMPPAAGEPSGASSSSDKVAVI